MDHASYIDSNENFYKVETIDDNSLIDNQVSKILSLLEGTDIESYKTNMLKGIDQHLAICVLKNDIEVAWFYGEMEEYIYIGNSIYSCDTTATILLFKSIFEINGSHKLIVKPASSDNMKQFLSLATGPSIREWNTNHKSITILRDYIVPLGYKAFHYLGLKEV